MKKLTSALLLALMMIILAGPIPAQATGHCYVNINAVGSNNGTSWTDAYTDLQSALSDTCTEIWVAAGTYTPHASDQEISFELKNGVALYGGFTGTETLLSDRDIAANITILSGDINNTGNLDGNSHHVVTTNNTTSSAILDGFTISGGNANHTTSGQYRNGGGIYNSNGSPTLRNLILRDNFASEHGGAMHNSTNSNPTLTDVRFENNRAGWRGGAIFNSSSNPVINRAYFIGNTANAYFGGGIYYESSNGASLTNAIFYNNSALEGGGGVYSLNSNDIQITNATFHANRSRSSGIGSVDGGAIANQQSTIIVKNSILWGNLAKTNGTPINSEITIITSGTVNVSYSIVQGGGFSGTGNLNSDPRFANPAAGNLKLQYTSPAIDAGTNTGCPAEDIVRTGRPQPQDGACDMGAYEFAIPSEFSKSSATNGEENVSLSPTLSWNATENESYYEYCYSSAPGPCTRWHWAGDNTSITLNGLAPDYTYYWQIRANGITEANAGAWWSFTTTTTSSCTWPAYTQPGVSSFTDVQMGWATWNWIERMRNAGITQGCGPGVYCPHDAVSRQHMAIFLLRGKYCGSAYTPPPVNGDSGFLDVQPGWVTAPWIKQLAADGITQGCGAGNYCPHDAVSRQHMAIFLLRAKHGSTYSPPGLDGGGSGFADVQPNWVTAPWIKQLAAEGITQGCGSGNYCPLDAVSRQHMAIFLVRAFGLP